jgi:hypothetical protein
LSHLIGCIKGHLKLWVCLTLQCTVLWMVRGLVSQIDPKERAKILDHLDHCVIKRIYLRVFLGIRPIIRKPHIICAVILVNPCFIHLHDIIPCFPKRFDFSQEDTVCPNFSQKKAVLQNYLTLHNIPFSATDTKKVLYEKIKQKLYFFPKAAYVSSLASFNRKVVLFVATKHLTCAHINSFGLSSQYTSCPYKLAVL